LTDCVQACSGDYQPARGGNPSSWIGASGWVPVVENSKNKIGSRMKATISVDHRVSDGAEAAQFMQALAGFLENPVRMLI